MLAAALLSEPGLNVLQPNARYGTNILLASACIAICHKAEAVHRLHKINLFECCD